MSSTRLRSPVVLLALVAGVCSAPAPVIGDAPAPARQPSVTTDVVYGHKDGLALTFDVHRPAQPNALTKAGVPASFIRIKGAGHGFEGAAPADLERASAAMLQWFEQHLGSAAK